MDLDTEILVVSLVIQDAGDLIAARKGKARADARTPDCELAAEEQLASAKIHLAFLQDCALARSMDTALRLDGDLIHTLCNIDQGEHDDHAAAVAMSRGRPLPAPTPSQRSLEISPSSITCVICQDPIRAQYSFHAPCGHRYCNGCLRDLVEASTRDESLYPLRCCNRNLDIDSVAPRLSTRLLKTAREKYLEFGTPSSNRVYCTNATCSAFLGPSGESRTEIVCEQCTTIVCSDCKGPAHPDSPCKENAAALAIRALALDEGWQTCPGCAAVVELNQGCFHITCRCRTSFCYLCAAPWKTCRCRQWDENRLISEAGRRVVNEFGARAAAEAPARHAERVERRMEELRVNHDCVSHSWTYRHGGGHCDGCNDTLPDFMLRCTNCQTLACKRCSWNRM
ncbi:hypothetical protein FIBSPDRAFT_914959 [Athelia psychrophila]|uniref:RBR-type E3 ubiquitin transferase n=1 Tax=Athelia psychrophila TaxID=1759441 RepID=A0A167VMH5_9AGAM|nr:hypothetical protein FIBSPDRAFT_914959 [Fibularhizoctonia sp. CBS 109695]